MNLTFNLILSILGLLLIKELLLLSFNLEATLLSLS